MEKTKETDKFYLFILKEYEKTFNELLEKDAQRVEFLRGKFCILNDILKKIKYWEPEKINYFDL